MTNEQKRKPKDGEWWWCDQLAASAYITLRGTKPVEWCGLYSQPPWFFRPIAPVISHELARELVEALKSIVSKEMIYIGHGDHTVEQCLTHKEAILLAEIMCGKVRAAGLDVPHD